MLITFESMELNKDKTEQKPVFQIDIEDIIAKKNPKLAKLLPKFVFKLIKRILHQNGLNDFLMRNKNRHGLDFALAMVEEYKISIENFNEDKIPREGRFIFAANHPLGSLESAALLTTISKYHKKLKFPVNDVLMYVENFSPIFLPINKQGSQTKESVMRLDKTFASNDQVIIFPAGLVSRKINGKITDLEWKKGFVSKAIEHKRDIIPVYIHARNSNFFYNLSRIRTKLGIKANIEMFFLADEMYKFKGNKIQYVFGDPISYETLTKEKRPQEWASEIKTKVYSLANLLPKK